MKIIQSAAREVRTDPIPVGGNARSFSTSTEIDLCPRFRWDTNSFYRNLGLTPSASRTDIRRAYLSVGGHLSYRLTHIVKTLLSRKVRERYDRTPLWLFWADDDALLLHHDEADEAHVETPVDNPSWGYYLVGVDAKVSQDTFLLWRSCVVAAWSRAGILTQVSVGFTKDGIDPYVRQVDGHDLVVAPHTLDWSSAIGYAVSLAATRARSTPEPTQS